MYVSCCLVWFGFALPNRSLDALDYMAFNKTLVIVWRQCFLSNNFLL